MERRSQILEAAQRLLLAHGPSNVTVADIAREAGVGVGTVYLEYKSKDDILVALSAQRYQHVLDAMRKAAADEPNVAERLRALLRARLAAFMKLAEDGVHGSELLHCYCPAVEAAWRRYTAAEEAIVAAVVAEGVEAGALQGNPAEAAEAVIAACATLSPPLLCKARGWDGAELSDGSAERKGCPLGRRPGLAERAERLFSLLVNGLRPR